MIGARRDGLNDRSERLGRTTLLPYDSSEIFLGYSQLDHRGNVALRFFNFDRFRVVDQLLRHESDQFFHGKPPVAGLLKS